VSILEISCECEMTRYDRRVLHIPRIFPHIVSSKQTETSYVGRPVEIRASSSSHLAYLLSDVIVLEFLLPVVRQTLFVLCRTALQQRDLQRYISALALPYILTFRRVYCRVNLLPVENGSEHAQWSKMAD